MDPQQLAVQFFSLHGSHLCAQTYLPLQALRLRAAGELTPFKEGVIHETHPHRRHPLWRARCTRSA
jgi:hypothetical protein